MREGICVAGNMIVDITYPVEGWPKQGELVHIHDGIARSTGGAVCNVVVDLAKLDPSLRLYAMGRIGDDAEGDLIQRVLGGYPNINMDSVTREGISAFCNVMADVKNTSSAAVTLSFGGTALNGTAGSIALAWALWKFIQRKEGGKR